MYEYLWLLPLVPDNWKDGLVLRENQTKFETMKINWNP